MFCPSCGAPIEDNKDKCSYCGRKIEVEKKMQYSKIIIGNNNKIENTVIGDNNDVEINCSNNKFTIISLIILILFLLGTTAMVFIKYRNMIG